MKTYHDLPAPPHGAKIRSDALTRAIAEKIEQHNGKISFSKFVQLALYHPQYGYYKSEDFDLGKHGDFTTAPEISPLFARCIARQCQEILPELKHANLYELGAGTGRLALDMLTELEELDSLPDEYYIYEISPNLRAKQQALFKACNPDLLNKVIWLDEPPKAINGILVANEVLDSVPFDRFTIQNGQIRERVVCLNDGELDWLTSAPSAVVKQEVAQLLTDVKIAEGYESEVNVQSNAYVSQLCQALGEGVMIFIDYGYGQHEYYHPQRTNGTMSCFYQHRLHSNPLCYPGLQDITAHVNFSRVIEVAAENGCELSGYTTQAAFLLSNGLTHYAEREEERLAISDSYNMRQAIKTLTMPTEMGDRVKVMAVHKNINKPHMTGFNMLDKRRDL